MGCWLDLRQRASADELMDDFSISGAELQQALTQLRVINYVLGGAWPTLEGVRRLWRQAGCPRRLRILDVGAGSGETSQLLLRWARRHGIDLHITLVDLNAATCAVAQNYHAAEPRISVVQADIFALPQNGTDIVTASLFLHHIPDAQLPAAFQALQQAARLGVVVNDLHRHWFALLSIWLATRLLSRNRMIRHDAPLSVRRGFRPADFERLRQFSGLQGLQYAWRPMFRFLVTLPAAEVQP